MKWLDNLFARLGYFIFVRGNEAELQKLGKEAQDARDELKAARERAAKTIETTLANDPKFQEWIANMVGSTLDEKKAFFDECADELTKEKERVKRERAANLKKIQNHENKK